MKSLLRIFRCILLLLIPSNAYAINKNIGKGYCTLRHPVEFLTGNRNTTCESQHIIQQDRGGSHHLNTIWINTHLHDYLDRSTTRPWKKQRPLFKLFGSKNLERSYMLGTWANGFHFVTYDHHSQGKLNLFRWDAVSHLVYAWTSIINYPQKELNYLVYQLSLLAAGKKTQILDALLGIVIDLIEVFFGLLYSILGIFIGAIFHPFDTIRNIIPGILLIITGTLQGIWQFTTSSVCLLTFGKLGNCPLK